MQPALLQQKNNPPIPFEAALETILNRVTPVASEICPLKAAQNRVLAQAVQTPLPLPLFTQSAMDGYAIRQSDVQAAIPEQPVILRQVGMVQAGSTWDKPLQPGQTVRIYTGGKIPEGADAVVMQEDITIREAQAGQQVCFIEPVTKGENIRYAGEEYQVGDRLLEKHVVLTPPALGQLASVGITEAQVFTLPQVAVVVTGNELRPPGESLLPGQIYESNGTGLCAALKELGLQQVRLYCCKDTRESLQHILVEAFEETDIILTVGGISVGDYDLVRETCLGLGVTEHFWRIAIKPGKPVFFGSKASPSQTQYVFGLPGNPVSALVTYCLLVRPALKKWMGCNISAETALFQDEACLGIAIPTDNKRVTFMRAKRVAGRVVPLAGQGSHMLGGLSQADCLLRVPSVQASGKTVLEAGERIPVEWLNWGGV